MESRKNTLVKISVLIDKMSFISENLLGQSLETGSPDIEILLNYNEKLQKLLTSWNSEAATTSSFAVPLAEDVPDAVESVEAPKTEEIVVEEIEPEVIEEPIAILEEEPVAIQEEVTPITAEEVLIEEEPPVIEQEAHIDEEPEIEPEITEVAIDEADLFQPAEQVTEPIIEEIPEPAEVEIEKVEVNQLFPDPEQNVAESIEQASDINNMYETESAPDLNASFAEDNSPEDSTVEEYAESIQDQILNTIKDLGQSSDKGTVIGGVAVAGAAALGINKLTEAKAEVEEEKILEKEKPIVESKIVEETSPQIKKEIEESSAAINEEHSTTNDSFFDFTEMNYTETAAQEPELNDKFASDVASVEVSEKLKQSFAGDLKQNIDINDRFTFIQTLFNGDYSAFDSTVGAINKCNSYSDAVTLLEGEIIGKYRWNEKEDVASQFIEIIRQKFI